MDADTLMSYGIEYEKGLKNCMGNLTFYKKILSMFLEDPCFSHAKAAMNSGDRKELFNRMHELKGISGNAALTELYKQSVPLVELVRPHSGVMATDEELRRGFDGVETAYRKVCDGIRAFLEE